MITFLAEGIACEYFGKSICGGGGGMGIGRKNRNVRCRLSDLLPLFRVMDVDIHKLIVLLHYYCMYEGISKSFEPNMERARNLDLFCFIFQRSPLPTPHTCPI